MSSDSPTPSPREDEPSQPHDDGISARRPNRIIDPEPIPDLNPDREEGISVPSPSGDVPRNRESRERWDDEEEIEEQPAPVPNRHPGIGWSFLWCLFFIFITQFIAAGGTMIIVLVVEIVRGNVKAEDLNTPEALFRVVLMPGLAAAQISGILFSLLVLRLVAGRDWYRQVALTRPGLAHFVLVLIGFPALPILATAVYLTAKHFLPGIGMPGMEEATKEFRNWPWQVSVLIVGLGPGLAEELWCRAFLGRGLVGNYGVILGALFTSIYFGLIHMEPWQGTMAAVMGIALHYSYITTRSLLVPMLLHFLNNSLSVGASHFPEGWREVLEKIDSSEWMPWYIYAAAGVLLISVGWSLYQSRARLVKRFGEGLTPWQPPFPGVAYPPPGSDHEVVRPWPHWSSWLLSIGALGLFIFAGLWYRNGGDLTQLWR
jgi:membrane protease YdiL (CAAX protease family)